MASMNWNASILTPHSSDTEPTVVVTFDNAKYIFNAGENTNRAFFQSVASWKRSRAIFATGLSTQRTSGVAGLMMTFADARIPSLHVVGPPGLTHLLATMRSYVYRNTMTLTPVEPPTSVWPLFPKARWDPLEVVQTHAETPPEPIYQDENITVYGVPVFREPPPSPSLEEPESNADRDSDDLEEDSEADPSLTSSSARKRKRDDGSPEPDADRDTKRRSSLQMSDEEVPASDSGGPSSSSNNAAGFAYLNVSAAGESDRTRRKTFAALNKIRNGPLFRSTRLFGVNAQAWRRYLVGRMFPKRSKGGNKSASDGAEEWEDGGPEVGNEEMGNEIPVTQTGEGPTGFPLGYAHRLPRIDLDLCDLPSLHRHQPQPEQHHRRRPGFHLRSRSPPRPLSPPREPPHRQPRSPRRAAVLPTLAYIVVGPRVRGKFDAKRAQELGIPNGPARGLLAKGETVEIEVLDDEGRKIKRTVRPEECVAKAEPPAAIVIVDVPSRDHIPSLLASFTTSAFYAKFRSRVDPGQDEKDREYAVRGVYHICGEGILEDERYIEFMNGFADDVHHFVASREHTPDRITFTSAAYNQLRLNQLDASIFPVPHFSLSAPKDLAKVDGLPGQGRTHAFKAYLALGMRPVKVGMQFEERAMRARPDRFHEAVEALQARDVAAPAAAAEDMEGANGGEEAAKQALLLPPKTREAFAEVQKVVQEREAETAAETARREEEDESMRVILETLQQARGEGEEVSGEEKEQQKSGRSGDDVLIVPLGTGSAVPTKYRNVSSTLIHIPGHGYILLDAGEGTLGQLTRHFGPDGVRDVLRELKCIFISHLHADHHMGVAKILATRRTLDPPPKDPLYLILQVKARQYLQEMNEIEDLGLVPAGKENHHGGGVISILSEALHFAWDGLIDPRRMALVSEHSLDDKQRSEKLADGMREALGLRSFVTVTVKHRSKCHAAVMKHNDGWSIVFSGDTRPTGALLRPGKNATLLIHEATMADDEQELAVKKTHSTTSEAVGIGEKMGARNILLTHFSARYPKIPPSIAVPGGSRMTVGAPEGTTSVRPTVALAFDLARLRIGDMWKMNCYIGAVEACMEATAEEEEEEGGGGDNEDDIERRD